MELVYVACQKKMVKFYSFDIDVFFQYLKYLYSINNKLEFQISKYDVEKTKESFQSLYPELELTFLARNVYLPVWEYRIWDSYFRGFYETSLELAKEIKKKPSVLLSDYELFMEYLGPDRIHSVINSGIVDAVFEYEQFRELRQKIEDI